MTTKDCQTIATLAEFKPNEREQMTDGVTLMNALESKNFYDKNNLQKLVNLFTYCELRKVTNIIEHYKTVTLKDGKIHKVSFPQTVRQHFLTRTQWQCVGNNRHTLYKRQAMIRD